MTDFHGTQPLSRQSGGRRTRSARIAVAVIAVVLIAVVLIGLSLASNMPESADPAGKKTGIATPGVTLYAPGDREPVPPLEGRTLDGAAFDLDDLKGQVIFINAWGSWCGPCRAETPGLVRVANATTKRGVQFVGIDTRDSLAAGKAFVRNYNVPYPSVFDPAGKALLPFGSVIPTAAIPSSLIVDRDGNVAARVIGAVDETTLTGLLDDLTSTSEGGA